MLKCITEWDAYGGSFKKENGSSIDLKKRKAGKISVSKNNKQATKKLIS